MDAEADFDDENNEDPVPLFSRRYHKWDLHTHAPMASLLYHLGPRPFVAGGPGATDADPLRLTGEAAKNWAALTKPKVCMLVEKIPTLKVPGGMARKGPAGGS